MSTVEGINDYPGQRLGLPQTGPGSVARVGRRIVGVAIDWLAALAVSNVFFGADPWWTLAVFGVMHVVLVATLGGSLGHRIVQVRLVPVGGSIPWPVRALIRTVALCLAVPALIWNADQRGLHDQWAGTLLVRG